MRATRGPVTARLACMALAAFALIASGCARRPPRQLTIALAVFPNEAARYQVFVADFARRNHVRVRLIAQSYGDILRVLRAQAGAGRGTLDLVELDLAMLGEARGEVENLNALATPRARALFPAAAWSVAGNRGAVRFIPHRLMWQAMIYNRRKVPNPPATWKELLAFARAHPGRVALKGARYEGTVCDAMTMVWGAGGSEVDPLAPGSLRAFEFLHQIAPYLNPQSAVLREMSALEAQARGEVWIQFNWPFAMAYLERKGLAPNVDRSAPIPAGPAGPATVLGGGYLAIPVSAPHPRLARRFLAWLLTARTQRRLSADLGWYGAIAPAPGSKQAALFSGFSAMRPYVRARPALACYAELSDRWQRATRQVLFHGVAPRAALAFVARGMTRGAGCECR